MKFRRSVNNRIVNSESYRKPYLDDEPYQDFMERVPYRAISEQFDSYPESEDQQPYKTDDDYQALEQTFYGPSTNFKFPQPARRNRIPNVKATCEELESELIRMTGKAKEKAYEAYHNAGCPEFAELFECWAYGCCCSGDVSYLQVECTYPISDGPYIRQADGSWLYAPNQATREDKKLEVPCTDGDGSCPPEIKVKIYSHTQEKEMRPIWLGKPKGVTCQSCPPPNTCCAGVSISIPSNQMSVGQSQTLTALNQVAGCTYEFRKISGGGKVTKTGTYTAPATNPNCTNNAVIGLYDVKNCKLCAQVSIAINAVTDPTSLAADVVTENPSEYPCSDPCPFGGNCNPVSRKYNCSGTRLSENYYTYSCSAPGTCAECVTDSRTFWGFGPAGTTDKRTTEMKAAGCCPSQLL